MILILSALSLLVIPAHASPGADPCSTVRLDLPGGSMEHVEVRNQRQIGSCYAHTAAQIYDSWRFRHGDTDYGHQSSGFEIGQRFKIREGRTSDEILSINGGFVESLIPMLLEQGSCSQLELDSLVKTGSIDKYASEIMEIFWKYRDRYRKERRAFSQARAERDAQEMARERALPNRVLIDNTRNAAIRNARSSNRLATDDLFRGTVLAEGVEELKGHNSRALVIQNPRINYEDLKADGDTVDMFETISIINCPEARRIKTSAKFSLVNQRTHYGDRWYETGQEKYKAVQSISRIHREFDKGLEDAFPVGISYCSSVLAEGKSFKPKVWADDECKRHASIIIGRQRNPKTNRCEFLIRNSWGSEGKYSPDWTFEKEKGQVWVDAAVMGRAIHDLQLVESK